ncbi:uncharacterized protein DS421_14g473740 [Arachis hypogaea]|nr:uncharacterized protein DS421_14g473740 [Arachis hypogaea]
MLSLSEKLLWSQKPPPELLQFDSIFNPFSRVKLRLLRVTIKAVAEPVWRPPLFRFSRSFFKSLWLLRKWFGAEVLVAGILIVDFGSRRKGLGDAFELWNLRFE